jgi:dipeptidyl aminopeptidase/acylaminoacyl peptidase
VGRLAAAPGVDPARLGIVGISKGAEAALLIAP